MRRSLRNMAEALLSVHSETLRMSEYGWFELYCMPELDDGIVDACFRFSRPVSGGYYWCPPVTDGRLDIA